MLKLTRKGKYATTTDTNPNGVIVHTYTVTGPAKEVAQYKEMKGENTVVDNTAGSPTFGQPLYFSSNQNAKPATATTPERPFKSGDLGDVAMATIYENKNGETRIRIEETLEQETLNAARILGPEVAAEVSKELAQNLIARVKASYTNRIAEATKEEVPAKDPGEN